MVEVSLINEVAPRRLNRNTNYLNYCPTAAIMALSIMDVRNSEAYIIYSQELLGTTRISVKALAPYVKQPYLN